MTAWPTLTRQPDVENWDEEQEDPGISTQMEGGYVVSRARYTRTPRKIFTFALIDAPNSDKVALQTFWDTVKGSSDAFEFTHPISAVVYNVRFGEKPKYKITGPGTTYRWDITGIKLEEV
jgi:hypothetical protein